MGRKDPAAQLGLFAAPPPMEAPVAETVEVALPAEPLPAEPIKKQMFLVGAHGWSVDGDPAENGADAARRLVAALVHRAIALVIDVRVPVSSPRKAQREFEAMLVASLAANNITLLGTGTAAEHLRPDPAARLRYLNQPRIHRLSPRRGWEAYIRSYNELLNERGRDTAIADEVVEMIESAPERFALLGLDAHPADCHRGCLADRLVYKFGHPKRRQRLNLQIEQLYLNGVVPPQKPERTRRFVPR